MRPRAFALPFAALLALGLWTAGPGGARIPPEVEPPEAVVKQIIRGDEIARPYVVTGEALVGLVQGMVDFSVEGSSVVYNRQSGQLFVRTTPSSHEQIAQILGSMRQAARKQVEIEARILTVSSTDFEGLGFDFAGLDVTGQRGTATFGTATSATGLPSGITDPVTNEFNNFLNFPSITDVDGNELGGQFSFASRSKHVDLQAIVDAMESKAQVNTLAAPRITVYNNQRANIKIEEARNFLSEVDADLTAQEATTLFVAIVSIETVIRQARSGTILDVTPTINSDGTITLDLHPNFVRVDLTKTQTLTNRAGSSNFDNTITLPVFTSQAIDTTLTIPNGGVAVLGGLVTETETADLRKLPWVADFPLIGKLVTGKQDEQARSYLVMFVKATVEDAKSSHERVQKLR